MRTKRPLVAGLIAGPLILTPTGPAGAAPPAEPTAIPGPLVAADLARTVTLITGDRVTVADAGGVVLQRGDGRDHITFLAQRTGEHQYVIPSDALPLLAAGQLDRRLFDVTLLRQSGYHDGRPDLPLIVTYDQPTALSTVTGAGGRVVRDLPAVDGAAVEVDRSDTGDFWSELAGPSTFASGVSTVLLDGLRQPLLDESVPQVGAPAAHDTGLDGTGVTVAVLDTGIDATHPDLAGRIAGQQNFTEGEEDDRDLFGHGTHVASILAGTGAASDGRYSGVAPGAALLDGKVCTESGCAESWLLAGMQWAAEQGASVVNMSLGGTDTPELDPVEEAVETLTDEFGVLFVIAAGNTGADASVASPASADAALAVGSVDKSDELSPFSSRGPRIDGALKPDLTAPGEEIVAANSKDGSLGRPGQPYTTLSGTSMSTPHAAGGAAILAQQHPDWSPEQLKAALLGSALPHPDLGVGAQGAGRLDVARLITQTATTSPASVSFGRPLWPHQDDEPQARTVTYRNHGEADLTLALALTATGPDGEPAPAGMFDVDAPSVTVPAGGSAEVSIAADTTVGTVDGYYGGHLTATSGELVVRTPFGVDREVESYDVTLEHIARDGSPTGSYLTRLVRFDELGFVDVFGAGSQPTVRMPAGEYTLMSFVANEEDEEWESVTLLAQPRLVVDGEQSVAVDAREGRPISVTVPHASAVPVLAAVSADITTEESSASLAVLGETYDGTFSGQLGPEQTVDGFSSSVIGTWAEPDAEGRLGGTPYTYDLAWFAVGEMVTGFERDVKRRELATIRAYHAAHVPGAVALKPTFGGLPGVAGGWAIAWETELPFRRTEYRNTDGGVHWYSELEEALPAADEEDFPETVTISISEPTAYQAGSTYREHWNYGVFGPVLPADAPVVSRLGDLLQVSAAPYGDRDGRVVLTLAEGTVTVFRDGEPIAASDLFEPVEVEVPPEPAEYRVEVELERGEPYQLSTATSLAWTFHAGHVDGETEVPLPVSVVRFAPTLDRHNTAPAGKPFVVPVTAQSQPGSDAGRPTRVAVEVSFDDGATWREAPVIAGKFVLVKHPRGDGFVSLRASVTDTGGSTVEQTIIRAYRIG